MNQISTKLKVRENSHSHGPALFVLYIEIYHETNLMKKIPRICMLFVARAPRISSNELNRMKVTQRRRRVSNLSDRIRYDHGAEKSRSLGTLRSCYAVYVLGTSHEPDQSALLPCIGRSKRHGGP